MKNTKDWIYFMRLPVIFLIVAVVGLYLILIANGYILNIQAKKFIPTGMIYIKSNPRDINVYVDNIYKTNKTPVKIGELSSGRYDIKLTKEKYHDWQKTVVVEPGLVNIEDSVVMFLSDPEHIPVTDDEIDAFKKFPNKLLDPNIKIINNSEIWIPDPENTDQQILVTRLSQPIKKTVYYSDKKHIIFHVNNEIRVMDMDGSNDIKLLELPNEDTAEFIIDGSGQYLYYQINNELKKVKIN